MKTKVQKVKQVVVSDKVINSIYQTKDYNKFSFHPSNREIKDPHVRQLVKSMREKGWIPGSTIVVNEKGEVIDGQHRLMAAMIVGVSVKYEVSVGAGINEIRELNKNQTNWTKLNHLEGFVKDKNPHYVILNNFMKDFPDFKMTECLMMCKNGFVDVSKSDFENGRFTVKDMNLARTWAGNIKKLKPYFPNGYNKSIFVRSLIKCLTKPGFVFDEFLHKVKIRPGSIYMCGTVDQYIEMIESIYNYKRSDKINLRF